MAWVPALSWRVTYHVAVLDTTRIHFCTIKNELVQVKGTNLVQQIEDHAPRSFTRIIRRVHCH